MVAMSAISLMSIEDGCDSPGATAGYDSNSLRGTPDWRMIDCNVPIRSSVWLGTGTVMVV